jgi:hypothetical protein
MQGIGKMQDQFFENAKNEVQPQDPEKNPYYRSQISHKTKPENFEQENQ